jgi:hypothetical protein
MSPSNWRKIALLLVLLAAAGCGSPALFQAETVIQGDGTCHRTIWQPVGEMLPPEASGPAWKARWKSVIASGIPSAFAHDHQSSGDHKYFTARGSFHSPADIPPHFRYSDPNFGPAPVSELVRSYEREDFVFVVEHRWQETLTNIVTPAGFLKARDEILDVAVPLAVTGIEQVYGGSYEVSGLTRYVREDGRRFIEELSVVFYQVMAGHESKEEVWASFADVAGRFGLDLFDPAGKLVASEEVDRRLRTFLRHRIQLGVRRKDGGRLTKSEIESILGTNGPSSFNRRWEDYWTQREKQLASELGPHILRMTGPYNHPFAFFGQRSPRFALDLRLPGELIETNGTIEGPDRTGWKFTADQSFPDGFAMKARSLEIDFDAQRKLLGRVAIADRFGAEAFRELLRENDFLLQVVRKVRETGDLKPLRELQPKAFQERRQAARLKEMLKFSP